MIKHQRKWGELFSLEKTKMHRYLGSAVRIEHIGSTSVPGIHAKPIIDIALGVPSLHKLKKYIHILRKLGYKYRGEKSVRGRHFFTKGPERRRTHHIHLVRGGSRLWQRHIIFRDYLRRNKKAAKRYNGLKRTLAKQFPQDRRFYLGGKVKFIDKIVERAGRTFGLSKQ